MFEQFLQERIYLKNISPETRRYYKWVRVAFAPILDNPSKEGSLACIQRLREKGVKAISVNSYLCGWNAYLMWLHKEHGKPFIKIPRLKEEQKILATLNQTQVSALIGAKFAKGTNIQRAHLVALTILSTGLRASEVLGITSENIDFDLMTFKVLGKGSKQRLVPFSFELRKVLWRFVSSLNTTTGPNRIIFGTKNNTKVSVRNLERDLQKLGERLGIPHLAPHRLRHTFATHWLKSGGDIYMLSRLLGHTNIQTTTIYLRSLGIEDIRATYNRVSILDQMKRSV